MPRKRSAFAPQKEYTQEEVDFMRAMDRYKREHNRPFPDCRDVLRVAHSLGYRKVERSADERAA